MKRFSPQERGLTPLRWYTKTTRSLVMTRFMLAAGVAALAISAPAAAKPGHGGGHGHAAAAQQHGGGHAQKARGGHSQKARGGGGHARAQHAAKRQHVQRAAKRQHAQHARKAAQPHHAERSHARQQARAEQRHAVRKQAKRHERAERRQVNRAQAQRQARVDRRVDRRQDRALARAERRFGRNNNPVINARDVARMRDMNRFERRFADNAIRYRAGGCPPGLAKKPVACVPPGQAISFVGEPLRALGDRVAFRDVPQRLQYVYRDTPDYYYRYGNGYMYRVNRESQLVSALLPLFGLGYTVGQPYPMSYPSYYNSGYYLPAAYQPFYPSTPNYNYRYANGYIYQIDPYSGLIADVDPMLGYGYGYGQMMPLSYSAYNVPYQYRPMYYDTSDYYYRYAPGAIYQVDPTTSLITAVAALLSPGLTVGRPLPMGYSTYNLPYSYRASYYDTPNDWYRYSNGYVYRVDPTTQLVTAIVASALT
jgi:hypothetical protein